MAPLSVEDVVRGTQGALVAGDLGVPVTGVSIDSRRLTIGEAFFAIRAARDGHDFLRDAAAHGASCLVVHTLPDGYDMVINEEITNISQGQMQLLTIARAVLADPRFLILDEATSSVDTRTEVLIQKAMDRLMENRTTFVIAHRLSTIRNADLILVMDKGDIVEQGRHEELLKRGGLYAKLYESQFERVVEEAEPELMAVPGD